MATWTGVVHAVNEGGTHTRLRLRAGASITVVAQGFPTYGDGHYAGPSGAYNTSNRQNMDPNSNVGSLLIQFGGVYTAASGGRLNWPVPVAGELVLAYNDIPGQYANNDGLFDVQVEYNPNDLLE